MCGTQIFLRSSGRIGSLRSLIPVAAKIAFDHGGRHGRHARLADAAHLVGCPGTMWTSTAGISFMRSSRIVVEVPLLHAALLERDLAVQRRREAERHAALHLSPDRSPG